MDDSHEIGTCENCFTQFVIKQDQIVQKITKNITKYVYGYEGKDIEELLNDGFKLINIGDEKKANEKFKQAINIEPNCWSAWLGYASTGGDQKGYILMVPAYRRAYKIAVEEKQKIETYVDMTKYLPDRDLRAVFIRAFNIALDKERDNIFTLVSGVIGCDESEIASLAVDLCPEDWRAYFAMAKFRQIRARWCELEGNFITGKRLPMHAKEVLDIFIKAYNLAKSESENSKNIVLTYINAIEQDDSYNIFARELKKKIRKA